MNQIRLDEIEYMINLFKNRHLSEKEVRQIFLTIKDLFVIDKITLQAIHALINKYYPTQGVAPTTEGVSDAQ